MNQPMDQMSRLLEAVLVLQNKFGAHRLHKGHKVLTLTDRRTDRIIDIAAKEKTWSLGIVKRQQTSNNAQF